MSKPRVLMIGGWTDSIQKAIDGGFDVTYFGPTEPGYWLDADVLGRCEHVQEVPVGQPALCLALARRLHAERPYVGVVSFTEYGLETSAIIADALGVKGLAPWPTSITRDKVWTRKVLQDTPALALPWQKVSSADDLTDFYRDHGPDVIVKPVMGAGSAGVRHVRTEGDLKVLLDASTWTEGGPFMAEKRIDSDDVYSVESLTIDGRHHVIAVSLEQTAGNGNSACTRIMVPPPPPFGDETRDKLARTAEQLLDAIGLDWGIAHTELMIDSDGSVYPIESQTRIGGGRIYQMAEMTTGFKQIDCALASLISDEVNVPHLPAATSVAVMFRLLAPPGEVKSVADPSVLEELDGVFASQIKIRPGQTLTAVLDNVDLGQHGVVWFQASDHAEAQVRMQEICKNYWVEYTDGNRWHPTI
ncbi:ATP-grasp domain-containing protein [Streptomyces sp. NPDC054787]